MLRVNSFDVDVSGEIEALKLAKIKECCAKSVEQAAGEGGRDATDGAPSAAAGASKESRPTTAPASSGSAYCAPPLASARARTGAANKQSSPSNPLAPAAASSSSGIFQFCL